MAHRPRSLFKVKASNTSHPPALLSVNYFDVSLNIGSFPSVGHCPEFRFVELPNNPAAPLEMTLVECPAFCEGVMSLPEGSVVITTPSPKLEGKTQSDLPGTSG